MKKIVSFFSLFILTTFSFSGVALAQSSNIEINISENVQGGVTSSVSYTVEVSGLHPNEENIVLVRIREDAEIGTVIFSEDTEFTADANGGFILGPILWDPLVGGGQLPQTNQLFFQAFLGSELSPQQDTVALFLEGIAETTETITNNPNTDECVETPGVYCLLEPIGTNGNIWDRITVGDEFGDYLNGIFQIGVALAGIAGVLMIVLGGFKYMTAGDSASRATDARKQITSAVLGVILALTSWILLTTINPGLVEFEIGIYDQPTTAWQGGSAPLGTNICPNHTLSGGQTITQGLTWPSDSTQRSLLQGAGISISSSSGSGCATAGQAGCTSVYYEGGASNTPQRIVDFKQACEAQMGSCNVVVTGGSECWLHSTHAPSQRIFDLRKNSSTPNTNAFIESFSSSGNIYNVTGFGQFTDEYAGSTSNTTAGHWHIELN